VLAPAVSPQQEASFDLSASGDSPASKRTWFPSWPPAAGSSLLLWADHTIICSYCLIRRFRLTCSSAESCGLQGPAPDLFFSFFRPRASAIWVTPHQPRQVPHRTSHQQPGSPGSSTRFLAWAPLLFTESSPAIASPRRQHHRSNRRGTNQGAAWRRAHSATDRDLDHKNASMPGRCGSVCTRRHRYSGQWSRSA